MNYFNAKKRARDGKKVRSELMPKDAYVVHEPAGFSLQAEDIWNKHNQAQAVKSGGSLVVLPYYIYFDGKSIQMGLDTLQQRVIESNWMEI